MIITTGRVRSGKIEIDDAALPEGAKVTVLAREGEETFELGPEDEASLLAAIAEAERGESVSATEVLRKIRRK
jgi:hypothetical protein